MLVDVTYNLVGWDTPAITMQPAQAEHAAVTAHIGGIDGCDAVGTAVKPRLRIAERGDAVMSAVISNSDPNTYLRAHADMEHDVPLADLLADPAGNKVATLDALPKREIITLRDKRNAERRASRERNETDAYIGTLDAKLSEMIERMQEGVRS
ncbi:MAG: hypothetical protein IPO08_24850 [Xanthomonadales bacterium]|nr:hypothetical protein [Xanthomonadales bacterium]